MPLAKVHNVTFYYEQRGVGPPLLCIPGALGTGASDFAPQLDGLSTYFTVIAPDPRGYGRSRPPERAFPPGFLQIDAADMAALMTVLGYDRFMVAGWSDGANVGALLAIANAKRVMKLVMWGGNSYISAEDMAGIESVRLLSAWSGRMRERMEAVYGDTLQRLWTAYCDAMQANYQAGGEICKQRLHLIRCPTLILHGQIDPIVPGFHACLFHEYIPNSSIYFFPQGKHNIHIAYADEFNQIILEFLSTSHLNSN
jgi:valacyclovir hydrolase